jgi:adenosylhomocysteine nucleosidase
MTATGIKKADRRPNGEMEYMISKVDDGMKRIGIIAAWEPELSVIARRFPALERHRVGAWVFNVHRDCEFEVVYVVCGVGKVYCASCTQFLLSKFSPDECI